MTDYCIDLWIFILIGMHEGVQSASENISLKPQSQYQIEKLQIREKNVSRPTRTETISASSDISESSILLDEHQRSRSRQRQSQQRTLSHSSMTNLLNNLQNIQLPSLSSYSQVNEQQQKENDDNDDEDYSLQLLIDLARDTDSTRIDKINRLHTFVEDSIGMVELLSLFRLIKSGSSLSEMNINEPPLNLYLSILSPLIALILLDNDI